MALLGACQLENSAPRKGGGICLAAPVFQAPPVNTCAGPERLRLAIVGDVLLHWQLQKLGYAVGFSGVWAEAAPFLASADIAIANLEGPVAPGIDRAGSRHPDPGPVYGTGIYTGFPTFNYHPVILRDLARLGIDLVTTANNHTMDRGSAGADLTLSELGKAGIGAVGSIEKGGARDFVLHQRSNTGTIAFIACSFSTNGIADPHRQVLMCYRDRAELLARVRREAANPDVAGVIVWPHWGQEYRSQPDANQQALA
ncbi:MAG: CapA family protein, partial [Rhodobacteraceae bacterium]|nr:CapA family protein [Paracoccaceae bacterium]